MNVRSQGTSLTRRASRKVAVMPGRLLSFVLAAALAVAAGRTAQAGPSPPLAPPLAASELDWLTGRWARPENAGYLEITWTALGGRWRGVLASVQREQPRQVVATYDLEGSKAGWTLTLREGKRRLLFPRGSAPGPQHLRFERRAGGAGPQSIDLRIVEGKLFIGQSGPARGGTLASSGLWLERVPAEAP
jgi:hypothetical protein